LLYSLPTRKELQINGMQVHMCKSKIKSGKTKALVRTATEVKHLNNEAKNEKEKERNFI